MGANDQIARIRNAKAELKTSIERKGVTVPEDALIDEYPALVNQIAATTSRLPEGYTEVEYIEITDQQYVDTNFKPNQDTKLIINLQITVLSIDKNNLLGARTTTSQNAYTVSTTDGCWRHGYGTATTATTKAVDTEWHEITMDKNKFYVDGVLVNTGTYKSFTCPVNLTIGKINHASTDYPGYARFGVSKVYDNDTIVRDYIPCIELSTMEKGMYDKQGNKFYTLIGQSLSQTVEQATPSIEVSSGGLITASATQEAGYVAAGTKSATKQLTTKGATTITPTSSVQTAVAAGTYCTGAIKVAASSGKAVYSGSFTPSNGALSYTLDTGVTLSSKDIFVMIGEVVVAGSINYAVFCAIKNSSVNATTILSNGNISSGSNKITFSGKKVTITGGTYASYIKFHWYLIKS